MQIKATNNLELLKFIGHACSNADSRQTSIDAFDFVLITNDENGLRITASNGNQTFIRECESSDVVATAQGSVCLDAGKLFQVVRSLPKNTPVSLKLVKGKDRAMVSCGRSRLQIKTIDCQNYPTVPLLDNEQQRFTCDAEVVIGMLKRTMYATGKKDVRAYLNSVMVQTINNCLFVVGTDGHRLAANREMLHGESVNDCQILIPVHAVSVLTRLSEPSDKITISISESRVEFKWGTLVYRTNLVDAKYPDIRRVIPAPSNKKAVVNRIEFIDVLSRLIVILAGEVAPKVKLNFANNVIQLTTVNNELGKGNDDNENLGADEISAIISEDIGFDFYLNPRYLIDALNNTPDDQVTIELKDVTSPALITPTVSRTSLNLVMPFRA
ncbi:DNA polymerase III subunit beta [Photobacterium damselae]|uniref:Beta sliding clamp n=1 Tax=Photobacterium damselae subsp. damselae TaxID=85581 RepID=A0A850R0C1_PHODD|nr:DNA polymerase III subunit beta [Photobacterium damselae]AWK84626.1 DNA polymerase III subunit beta [Photobacterium damselae]MBE8127640.1 DNA polymerase III subunit beta [Photobacterium damselae subsp. piscicida]NVP03434.1 DNA polymerase III subunit beta [Photobacterium damselae subsp. damselae]TLS84325.1 DNA polymerase III subunit beta [Photobacterium damselae subsp. damselae]WIH21910.1 DNA polymerase III subunit beta [Photobacterium damselae]